MAQATALLDACVLYPAPLRDLLMYLVVKDVFRARWTDAIHEEWIRSVQANRPDLKREQLERTRKLLNTHARDCLVTGYEGLIDTLSLPDPDDRHVLAAAIHARVATIVTFNLSDFPIAALDKYGIKPQHPDVFVCKLIDAAPDDVLAATRLQRESLKNPPKSVEEYLTTLEAIGLTATAARLRIWPDRI